ncbi:hypothetical protein LB452_08710 [Psychroflexus sp. CAK8W]|uniref:GLPGLI family protein n=1 Tax=Psychroflexus longus TaxID=2873596 RepID=A0ABS7XJ57_9FLAO|nr:hypothetical protein [Psychroflexus longus]MBZ9779002.1 hypothetical protein [Psychroflexus longus]
MIKLILILTLYLVSLFTYAQTTSLEESVYLKWKITDTLTYHTAMRDTIYANNKSQTESDSVTNNIDDLLQAMQTQFFDLNYETKLFPDKNGNVDIAMMLKENKTDSTRSIFSGIAKMNGNVALRGKVSPEGELLSRYYKTEQNNIISILFELPTSPVKVGDEWSLDVNMISMDQNFKADSIYMKNTVKLSEIKILNGNKIAVLKYDLQEFVSGEFDSKVMSMFSKESANKETFMKISHKATAEFDIDKGYWILYDGEMDTETNFSPLGMNGNKRTKFKLTPVNKS